MKKILFLTVIVVVVSFFSWPSRSDAVKPSDFGLKEGDLISAIFSDDPDVYIVNEHGYKRLFLNPEIFKFYTHLGGFTNIKLVTPEVRDSFPTVGFFRNCEDNDQKVFGTSVEGEDSGRLHWINKSGDQAVQEDPEFFKKVFCINRKEFNWYPRGTEYKALKEVPQYHRTEEAEKPVICHHPSDQPNEPKNFQTIRVAPEALDAHFQHGDTKGACSTSTIPQTSLVDVKVNGSDNPTSVPYDSLFTVSWTSKDAVSCRDFGPFVPAVDGGVWAKYINLPTSGAKSLYARHESQGYIATLDIQVQCTNAAGQISDDVVHLPVQPPTSTTPVPTVSVVPIPVTTPVVSYLIKPMTLKDILKIESVTPYDVANLGFGVYKVSAQYNLGAYHQGKWYEGLNPGILEAVWIEFGWPNTPQVDVVLRDENDQQRKIYLPATGSNKNPDGSSSNWYYWISEDGSSYYARKDHNYGWPDLSSVDSLRPEHIARKVGGTSTPITTPSITPTPTPTIIASQSYSPTPTPTPTAISTTNNTCLTFTESQKYYFDLCKKEGYDNVCLNKTTGAYQGCTRNTYNDCTLYNVNKDKNLLCPVSTVSPTPTLTQTPTPTLTPTPTPTSIGDTIAPVVSSFDAQPRNTTTSWVVVTFTITDAGGSHIRTVSILRALYTSTCSSSNQSGCAWSQIGFFDNGATSVVDSMSSHTNDAPAVGTYLYGLKVTDGAGNTVYAPTPLSVSVMSPTPTPTPTPVPAASITITYPNGGETWEAGKNYNITWNSTGNINGVLLFLANEAGQVIVTNLVNVNGNPGSAQWNVSSSWLGHYRILIHGCSALNCTVGNTKSTESSVASDLSDSYFNIVSSTPTTRSNFSRNLTMGSTGDDVKQLQALLVNEVGYSANLITGYFGSITQNAVKKLQEKYGVRPVSGYFGAITRRTLDALISN